MESAVAGGFSGGGGQAGRLELMLGAQPQCMRPEKINEAFMKAIEIKPYQKDPKSFFAYLGSAQVKAIVYQSTENSNIDLLDIVFATALDDNYTAELLSRLETSMQEMNYFLNKLKEALQNPKPHPYDEDLFDKAVTGQTGRERNKNLLKSYFKQESPEAE
jgi:hypothetical protein